MTRAHPKARRELARSIRERLAWLRQLHPRGRRPEDDDAAVGALACMVGGIIVARAMGEKDSGAILEACRRFLHRATGTDRMVIRVAHP